MRKIKLRMARLNHSLFRLFLRSLLQGLVILGPIGATLGLIWYLVSSVDSIIPSISRRFPGTVFVAVILLTALVGYLGTRFFLGRMLVDAIDRILEHTPGIKYIYTSLKDVLSSFMGDSRKFSNPVWVKTNANPEIWRIGFLTQEDLTAVGLENRIAVYLPHSYAISGWVILTTHENLRPVKGMSAVEAMKFAVSGGVSGAEAALEEAEREKSETA